MNYIEYLLILASAVTGCVSISGLASLDNIPIDISSSAEGLKICAATAEIWKYESTKKKSKHDKIILLTKTKLITIEVFISRNLIDSYIIHHKFVLVHKVLREYDDTKSNQKSKNFNS